MFNQTGVRYLFFSGYVFLGLILGCNKVRFFSPQDNQSSIQTSNHNRPPQSPLPPGDRSPASSQDCVEHRFTLQGQFVVRDPNGYTAGHSSCLPTMESNHTLMIPPLREGESQHIRNQDPLGLLIATFDAVNCDRSFITVNYSVTCRNQKLQLDYLEIRYLIGRFDEDIYLYRNSFTWTPGRNGCTSTSLVNGSRVTCSAATTSYDIPWLTALLLQR